MQTRSGTAAEILEEKIRTHAARVGIVGLGYVGLPLAVEFAKAGFDVTGIDVEAEKVAKLSGSRAATRHLKFLGRGGS
jgi:UDP-N-acetyl-D-glucosamine dehydrogenase